MKSRWKMTGLAAGACGLFAALVSAPANAAEGLEISGYLNVDAAGVISGGDTHRVRELDKLVVTADADFEKLAGWKGASGVLTLMNVSGAKPNADTGSLQGVDNIEVGSRRARIYEAWYQQTFGGDGNSLKVGLMDLNSEFYVDEPAALLLSPQSGIGSEFAATGPGGPSIYPQTSLAIRLALQPAKNTYLLAGLFDARVGDPGDKGGVDTSLDDGVIEVVEGGWRVEGGSKLAFGAWRYSKAQDDLFDTRPGGAPVGRTSGGAYMLAEKLFIDGGDKGRSVTGFLRAGFSDGNTGPFKSSWNAGVMIGHAVMSRPDSQLSIGIDQATLGDSYRAASAAGGTPLAASETHFEITYSDKIAPHLTLQPDLQYLIDPGGRGGGKNAVVAILRLTADF